MSDLSKPEMPEMVPVRIYRADYAFIVRNKHWHETFAAAFARLNYARHLAEVRT